MRFGRKRRWSAATILEVLDASAVDCRFPSLDNGYVHLAATRLSIHRSREDWALVIEVFGFSPRAGAPDTFISTFGSTIANRKSRSDFVDKSAYDRYLATHPRDDSHAVFPVSDEWIDDEVVAAGARTIEVRGMTVALPSQADFDRVGIQRIDGALPAVFEVCRFLAESRRSDVLATATERRFHVPADLDEVLVLDEWRHPDVIGGEMPSHVQTFVQLAEVLSGGDAALYSSSEPPNTHWSNWPKGGTL
jgi:hypothetical protein